MKNAFLLLTFAIASQFTVATANAGEALETNSFKEIEKKVLTLGKKHGPKNVLVVLDIDNTVLTMPKGQDLGSDQWFTWQYTDCIKAKKKDAYCISNDMGKLLDLQGDLFALSRMVPTEKVTAGVIKNLQEKGYKVILLTSRGYSYRNSTERDLKAAGLRFNKSSIGPKKGFPGTYVPYDVADLKKYGITKEEAAVSKLKGKGRKVSFMNGIMMTSGLNKGIMLKTLLHKTGTSFKAVVFADDHVKHTVRMQAVMGNKKGLELVTYRYGAIDPQVKAFKASDKKAVIKAYNDYNKSVQGIFK